MRDENKRVLARILGDKLSGSQSIASVSAELILELLGDPEQPFPERERDVEIACELLRGAHPEMRAVALLCERIAAALASGRGQDERERCIRVAVGPWGRTRMERTKERIASHLVLLLERVRVVAAHSLSSTVETALRMLKSKKGDLRVIQSVSYPAREGLVQAERLAGAGIEVELIADAGLPARVGEAGAALVGADSVGADGVLNKQGTFALAVACRHLGVPIYSAFDSTKLVRGRAGKAIAEREPGELAQPTDRRIRVTNVYFDLTPLELFTKLVTEEGALSPDEARRLAARTDGEGSAADT